MSAINKLFGSAPLESSPPGDNYTSSDDEAPRPLPEELSASAQGVQPHPSPTGRGFLGRTSSMQDLFFSGGKKERAASTTGAGDIPAERTGGKHIGPAPHGVTSDDETGAAPVPALAPVPAPAPTPAPVTAAPAHARGVSFSEKALLQTQDSRGSFR
jgi:hypothetical protein